ncbi:Hypothetical protein NTJ_01259 [Nesidiocoris tenuis]|uniref:Uncharacterized protein n=1 Tax=Nesidiocoris tenuis TaxID=355587 RepID=A0ABN7A847_9HEMI|nr:Hypothetical protein NTJ_01259 [Nesidiocoris tenuis]
MLKPLVKYYFTRADRRGKINTHKREEMLSRAPRSWEPYNKSLPDTIGKETRKTEGTVAVRGGEIKEDEKNQGAFSIAVTSSEREGEGDPTRLVRYVR